MLWYRSAYQLRVVLVHLDVCPDPGVRHLVLCVRRAGQRVDHRYGIHGESICGSCSVIPCITHLSGMQAIALYQMVRAPLNVIPAWIVQMLQVRQCSM